MKILLSNLHLKEFGGSELVTVELAEYYASLGHEVTLYSPMIGAPLITAIKRHNVALVVKEPSLDELYSFDIIWSHHGLLLETINAKNKLAHQLIISNHMSSFLEVEQPSYSFDYVDIILANSQETRAKMSELHRVRCRLFQNPARPASFKSNKKRPKPLGLSVSNHRPAELLATMAKYQSTVDFELFGMRTQNYKRITTDLIAEIDPDFIICNGKTTQQGLVLGVPIFLYDSFGGPGWLNEENFELAEFYNFSGRGFSKKTDFSEILLFNEQSPINMTEERKKKFTLEGAIKELGIY